MEDDPRLDQPDADADAQSWREYAATRDPELRIRLIERYLPTAQMLAAYLFARRVDRNAEFDDYLQYARIGLIESVDRYDPTRAASFVTYASYRIRGAVLNGVERSTEGAATATYRHDAQRERAESLREASSDDAFEDLVDTAISLALGYALEDSGLADAHLAQDPYRSYELKRLHERLVLIVEALPPRERAIIRWHYFEHLEFKLIGQALELSKGRVSQLHARALQLIREGLRSIDRFDLSF